MWAVRWVGLFGYYISCTNALRVCPTCMDRISLSLSAQSRSNEDEKIMSRELFLKVTGYSVALTMGISPMAASAMTNDPTTGIALPDVGEIAEAIPTDWSDVENPFVGGDTKTLFGRLDSKPDSIFYSEPKLVEHVDEQAVRSMTEYICNRAMSPPKDGSESLAVLDLCSSWTSHVTPTVAKSLKSLKGLGMNAKELELNSALTEWTVQDLNANPRLPYEDNSLDVVLCQLSVDYLTRPLEVLKEVGRVLKSGTGKVHILFSNRLFLTKAVGLWTGADDIDHAYYVGSYLHFCEADLFENILAEDLSVRKGRGGAQRIVGDPLYVVSAQKRRG